MIFNFVLTNLTPARLQVLDDVLWPIFVGLRAAGHRVVAASRVFRPYPALNVVVEDFTDANFVSSLASARAAWPGRFKLGVLCVDMPGAPGAEPARPAAFHAALPGVDFVWTLAPEMPTSGIPAARVAAIGYGFDGGLAGPRLIAESALRDLDVVVYGTESRRRDELLAALKSVGIGHFLLRAGALPDYLATDLLSRAKLVVVAGDGVTPLAALAPRILKAICNGALVLAEDAARGPLAEFVIGGSFADLPRQCREQLAKGNCAERGIDAFERLRSARSMRDGLAAALDVAASDAGGGR